MRRKRLRLLTMMVTVTMMLCSFHSALAMEVFAKDEEIVLQTPQPEPLVTPDPNQVELPPELADSPYVENDVLEDTAKLELHWNGTAYAKYGCTTASMSYENTTYSNIDIKLIVGIFDEDMLRYFGTTFRSEEEQNELAMEGYEALQSGITLSSAYKLVELGYFGELSAEEIAGLTKSELVSILGEQLFAGMTEEELNLLSEEGVKNLTELNKLTLAQLGSYDFSTFYTEMGETGAIEPGHAIYQVDLHTIPGWLLTLPWGEYEAVFVLNAYDKVKNEFSDVFIHLPVTIVIEEDLPEELQLEYGVSLAERIDR